MDGPDLRPAAGLPHPALAAGRRVALAGAGDRDDDTQTIYTDTGLSEQTTYAYELRAIYASGWSAALQLAGGTTLSAPVQVGDEAEDESILLPSTLLPTDPPAAPTGLSALEVRHDRISLTWDASEDDTISGYRIWRRVGDDAEATLVEDTQSAATNYVDTTVEAETRYRYRVAALNAAGASEASATLDETTPVAPPPPPTGLIASAVTSNSVSLNWDAVDDKRVTGYRILRHALWMEPGPTVLSRTRRVPRPATRTTRPSRIPITSTSSWRSARMGRVTGRPDTT